MDGFPLKKPSRSRRMAFWAAASVLAALAPRWAVAQANPLMAAFVSPEALQSPRFEAVLIRARYAIVEESDKDGILQRLTVLDGGIDLLAGNLADLTYNAGTLHDRCDQARVRASRDGYFAFDMATFSDAVWTHRAETALYLEEVARLSELAGQDRDISRRAAKAAKTAAAAAARAAELSVAVRGLDASAGEDGERLLGENAEGLADASARDAADIAVQTRLLTLGLAQLALKTQP